ncbi:MFS transporter [Anaerosolibacter sp.]|uniref:MFS transporter n=1 Tax=Anaerosolibacter sp. TaxID=1872527 RepID=UPI0039EE232E
MKREKRVFNINFILYLMGRMISDTGTSIQMMTMPLYIIDAGGSAATVGLFSFASLVPALLIYPFAGVLGDRMNRKTIMVITDFVSAGVILGLAFISYLDKMSLTLLLLGQIIISLLNGLFDPATRGMLPQLVGQDELTKANSKVASLRGLSVLLGPVIGTALYANFGITVLFLINGISFLLSGISEMMIRYKHVKRESAEGISGIAADLLEGMRFILANKIISKLCYFFLVLYSLIQPIFSVVLPLFYKTHLNYPDTQYGYLQSILVLGMLVGSVFVGLFFGKDNTMFTPLKIGCNILIGSMLMFSLLMFPNILFVLGNDSILYFALLAVILCLFSAANMFINVPVQSFIQRETSNEYMSRVFSIVGMITRGGMPFGALLYGIVLDRVEVHWIVLGATLLVILIFAGFLSSLSVVHHH